MSASALTIDASSCSLTAACARPLGVGPEAGAFGLDFSDPSGDEGGISALFEQRSVLDKLPFATDELLMFNRFACRRVLVQGAGRYRSRHSRSLRGLCLPIMPSMPSMPPRFSSAVRIEVLI